MGSTYKLARRILLNTRTFHSHGRISVEPILPPKLPNEISIYKVPNNIRMAEPKAYVPKIVSIGPYNRGLEWLQTMEIAKRESLIRLSDPSRENCVTQDTLFNAMKGLEPKVRACYSESTAKTSSDEFVETLVTDGCFILEIFRESMKETSTYNPIFTRRWMLPVLRRDLIMLENQIPLFVLSHLFDLTRKSDALGTTETLEDLAMKFFNPLMPRDEEVLNECIARTKGLDEVEHLLALFRSSFLPRAKIVRGKMSHMFRSIKETRQSGVKIKKFENCGTLDICFNNGVLKIPPLLMDDYTATLLRNVVAFEQCHWACHPDFTSYLFFLTGLIDTSEDVEILHDAGVIQHSLGSDGELANLVNSLCREVDREVDKSYLHSVSRDLNIYCSTHWNKWSAEWRYGYLSSPWAVISLLSGVVFFVLTIAQTWFDYVNYKRRKLHPLHKR